MSEEFYIDRDGLPYQLVRSKVVDLSSPESKPFWGRLKDGYEVSNAFRHSSVSGPTASAFTSRSLNPSPMPFGIRPFRDTNLCIKHVRSNLLVSNAFRHSSVSGPPPTAIRGRASPRVSNAFRHSSVSGPDRALSCRGVGGTSPMPFGIRPFRDENPPRAPRGGWSGLQCLSAFVRFGTCGSATETSQRSSGLQCLSAFVRFGTESSRVHM